MKEDAEDDIIYDVVEVNTGLLIQNICNWNPQLLAIQRLHAQRHQYKPGSLTRIGQIVIGYALKDDVTRILTPQLLKEIDMELCKFFSDEKPGT